MLPNLNQMLKRWSHDYITNVFAAISYLMLESFVSGAELYAENNGSIHEAGIKRAASFVSKKNCIDK